MHKVLERVNEAAEVLSVSRWTVSGGWKKGT